MIARPDLIMFSSYLKRLFGVRVRRVALDAGFTCPNRDGTKGTGGCIYCDNRAFNPCTGAGVPVVQQLQEGMAKARRRFKATLFLPYFQTYTNTYAPVEDLKKLFESVLDHPDVAGLIVSTRPDCAPDEVLDLLAGVGTRKLVWLEFGIQSCHDATLRFINRGHTTCEALDAVQRARRRNLNVAAHVIIGLPGETRSQLLETSRRLADSGITGVKLHHLHAVCGTILESMLLSGDWTPMTAEEYIGLACEFLSMAPKGAVIMRLIGECPDSLLAAPRWKLSKQEIERRIKTAMGIE